jgi:hypothetical protein
MLCLHVDARLVDISAHFSSRGQYQAFSIERIKKNTNLMFVFLQQTHQFKQAMQLFNATKSFIT